MTFLLIGKCSGIFVQNKYFYSIHRYAIIVLELWKSCSWKLGKRGICLIAACGPNGKMFGLKLIGLEFESNLGHFHLSFIARVVLGSV